MVAGSDFADDLALLQYGISVTGNSLICEFYSHELLCHTVGFLLHEGFLADELWFVELTEHREPRHHRRDIGAELIAV